MVLLTTSPLELAAPPDTGRRAAAMLLTIRAVLARDHDERSGCGVAARRCVRADAALRAIRSDRCAAAEVVLGSDDRHRARVSVVRVDGLAVRPGVHQRLRDPRERLVRHASVSLPAGQPLLLPVD